MSRRGGSSSANGIQLLPFLDILTCTMGALVTLLFAFARYGQQQVVKVSDAKQVAAEAAAADEIEDLQWRSSMLRESRAKTEADLEGARLELSHLEDHLRRLRQRAEQLHQAAIALENADPKAPPSKTDGELAKLTERITLTAQELELARKNAAGRPTTYSIVPYAGPNQTRRRPIYIECRAEGVVLEPEGIVFTDDDFAGPLGPGNPLAAAVRAAREYMATTDPDSFDKVEPYPLLVVRPDAIPQYYAARTALISFGSQFGYELIGADKKLKFPDADPKMGEIINSVVAEARVRQAQLIAAAPKRYHKSKASYHVKPGGGGIEREPEPRVAQNDRNPYRGIGGRGKGSGGNGTGANGPGANGNGPNGTGGNGTGPNGTGPNGTGPNGTGGNGPGGNGPGGNANGGLYAGGGNGGFYAGGNGTSGMGATGQGGGDPLGGGNLAGGGGSDGYGSGAAGTGGNGTGTAGTGGIGTGTAGTGGNGAFGTAGNGTGALGPGGYGAGGGPTGAGGAGGGPAGAGGGPGGYTPGGGGGNAGGFGPGGLAGGAGGSGYAMGAPSGSGGPGTPGGVPGSGLSALAGTGGAAGAGGGPNGAQSGVAGSDTPGGAGQGNTGGKGGDGTKGNSPGSPGQGGSSGGGGAAGRVSLADGSQPGDDDAADGAAGGSGSATPLTTTLQGTGGSAAGSSQGTGSGSGPGGGGLGGMGGKPLGDQADTMPTGPQKRGGGGGPAVPDNRANRATNANAYSLGGGADDTGPSNNSANTTGGVMSGGGSPNGSNPGSSGSNSSGSSGGMSGGPTSMGGQQQGVGMPNLNFGQQPQDQPQSGRHGGKKGGGQSRAPGWGLPDAPATSASVARPVVIECWSDKLVMLGDDGKTIVKEIPLTQHTEDAVDELVSSVWQQMKQWGAAGKGLSWRPTLTLRVAPNARSRFTELQTLLADSGLEVKESTHKLPVATKPKIPFWK